MKTADFFSDFSPIIELDEVREKNVSIAFVFDQTPMRYNPASCIGYYSPMTCKETLDDWIPLGSTG